MRSYVTKTRRLRLNEVDKLISRKKGNKSKNTKIKIKKINRTSTQLNHFACIIHELKLFILLLHNSY